MASVAYKDQKKARSVLKDLFSNPQNILVIHYSCESFYNLVDGKSPRVTSIAVRNLADGQTDSFSIHKIAEIHKCDLKCSVDKYDDFEKEMLYRFYEFVGKHEKFKWLHWNMRDINYGFQALEHRYKVLGGTPVEVQNERKIDLPQLLCVLYGGDYIENPRLESLMVKNNITKLNFLNGKEEADAFVKMEYVKLHQSTLRKVDIISRIAKRACNGDLKTNASWWVIRGGSVQGVIVWLREHPVIFLLSIFGNILSILGCFKAIP